MDWLYAGYVDRLPPEVCRLIENNELYVSPIALLELQYLKEIGRLTVEPTLIIEELSASIRLKICKQPFADIIRVALSQTWTRDPFDRIIVGNAALHGTILLTKDTTILDNYERACWR